MSDRLIFFLIFLLFLALGLPPGAAGRGLCRLALGHHHLDAGAIWRLRGVAGLGVQRISARGTWPAT